eukprot:CAMPEP_0203927786 /NCGR_PEP_ID=MMETSP0359-20131031/67171_1 /ASSEMBLY_ACC=CAM_ASM_000338 /TAXON_ID=268821 /ORGANISM="Scrippsiella Hangoei, Strain SHTV-5" /LENGTH=67 /DNA_ID=CAMNT_0050856619 /DNA_START=24 /DNA_END=223 /DNA_ORIENTATION=+
MAPDARAFFEGASNGANTPGQQDDLPEFEVDSGEAQNRALKVPIVGVSIEEWCNFAPYAQLPNVGNP